MVPRASRISCLLLLTAAAACGDINDFPFKECSDNGGVGCPCHDSGTCDARADGSKPVCTDDVCVMPDCSVPGGLGTGCLCGAHGECGSGAVCINGNCEDDSHSIAAQCTAEHRQCYDNFGAGAICGICDAGYREAVDGTCVPVAGCAALACPGANRKCVAAGDHTDAVCGVCVAGMFDDKGICARANCEGDATPGSLAAGCAALHRLCNATASGAACGDCLFGFADRDGHCVPVVTCEDLGCVEAFRACTGATAERDASCGDCIAGRVVQEGVCQPIPGAVCDPASGVCTAPHRFAGGACSDALCFAEITASAGITWTNPIGSAVEYGGGAGILDYDADGLLDFIVAGDGGGIALYRNIDGLTFEDRTVAANLPAGMGMNIAMGVTVADYDNDGDDDLLLITRRGVRLYDNAGGQFTDVTDSAGLTSDSYRYGRGLGGRSRSTG